MPPAWLTAVSWTAPAAALRSGPAPAGARPVRRGVEEAA